MKNTYNQTQDETFEKEITVTDASPVEVQKQSKTFVENLEEGVKYLSEFNTLTELLQFNQYNEKEIENFRTGLKCLISSTFVKIPKSDMAKYANNTYAKIRFAESIIKLIPLKIIPNTTTYYIAPRAITNKKTGEVSYDFKIDLQYQAKIDTLENKGIEIIRVDYILAEEWSDFLQDISTGELIINHKPKLIERKDLVKSGTAGNIIGAYVVYKRNNKIKYFMIDYERIDKAHKSAIKQKSDKINWSGTGGDGAKKTAIHRLFDLIINKNIEDNEVNEYVNEQPLEKLKAKSSFLTTGTEIIPEPIELENVNEIQVNENGEVKEVESLI